MNNTIYGTVWHQLPDTGNVPLVADISSCILSEPIDVSQVRPAVRRRPEEHGPCRADRRHCAGGPAGRAPWSITPTMFNYKVHGGQRLHVQHAALLAHLHLQAGAGVDQERHRRPGENGGAQRAQGRSCSTISWTIPACSQAAPIRRTAPL